MSCYGRINSPLLEANQMLGPGNPRSFTIMGAALAAFALIQPACGSEAERGAGGGGSGGGVRDGAAAASGGATVALGGASGRGGRTQPGSGGNIVSGGLEQVPGATWYVSPTGTDTNDGKALASAFKTIQKGADAAQAGDMVLVHAGTYRERVTPPRGGASEEQRIIYRAAPGEKVVITGLEVWEPSWQADGLLNYATPSDELFTDNRYIDGGNPFKIAYADDGSGTPLSLGQVVVDGEEWKEQRTKAEAVAMAKSWWAERATGSIFINFGGPPVGRQIQITARRGLFRPFIKGLGYITIRGFDFEYCGNNAGYPGVVDVMHPYYQSGMIGTRQGHHWRILDNRIRTAKGVGLTFGLGTDMDDWFWWDPHGRYDGDPDPNNSVKVRAEIDYPYVSGGDNETDKPYAADGKLVTEPQSQMPSRPFKEVGFNIIAGNVFEGMGMNAIASIGSSGNTIYGNRFANNVRFLGESSAEDAVIKVHMQQGLLIERNLFEDFIDDHRVIWLDNNVVGARVSRNVFVKHKGKTPLIFFEISSSLCQYLSVVDNNLFIDSDHAITAAVADGIAFYNNLFFRNGDGLALGANRDNTGADCGNMRIHHWNNLFVDQERTFGFGFSQAINFHTSDYNIMHRPAAVPFCKYFLSENGTGDGGNRKGRPWCTTSYTQADIDAAKSGGSYWQCDETWGAANAPRGCEGDLGYFRGTMGADVDRHSEERAPASGSYTARTLTLELGTEPALPGASAKKGALIDFHGRIIAGAVKAGPFQDLGAATTTYEFWNDDALPALPALPMAPTGVLVGKVSDVRTRVAWTNAAPDASYMAVERRADGGPWKFWGYITTTQEFFEDYDLAATSSYEYRLAARNAAGLSSWVEAATIASPPAAIEGDCKWPGQ